MREVLGAEVPDERRSRRLVERAGGNPFYLEELIRAVAEGKRDALPGTVLAMVQARLERARAPRRGACCARRACSASCSGAAASRRCSASARQTGDGASGSRISTERELVERAARRASRARTSTSFRHALVREAAYAMLTDEDRELGHRLAGDVAGGGRRARRAGARRALRRGGGAGPRGDAGTERAAEQALEGNDLDAAVARAERGIACGASGELRGRFRSLQAEARLWPATARAARSPATRR